MSQPAVTKELLPDTAFMTSISCHDVTLTMKSSEDTENMSQQNTDPYGGKNGCKNNPNDEFFPPSRMKHYSDSVMASSKLFLAIPALKVISDAQEAGITGVSFLKKYVDVLPSFALSFSLISMYWRTHNELFRHVKNCTSVIEIYNNIFLFVIATLPIISFAKQTAVLPPAIFVANLMLVHILLTALHVSVRKDLRKIEPNDVSCTSFGILFLSTSFIVLAITMVIVCLVPDPKVLHMLFSVPLMKPATRYFDSKYNLADRYVQWIVSILKRGRPKSR